MGHRKPKKSTKKSPPTPGITTRNASHAQTSASVANATVHGRIRSNPTAGEGTATKQSCGNRLTKKDIPKLLKKVMEAFEEMDSKSNGEAETPTTVEELETMEEQGDNTVGMW